MTWLLNKLGLRLRRRVSTKLTPRYSDRRAKELRKAREWFVEHNQVRA